jgi:hypothetical protein
MEPYRDSFEHLRHEILRLDLMLRRAVLAGRPSAAPAPSQEYRGLVISEGEIDQMLEGLDFMGEHWRREASQQEAVRPLDEKLAELRAAIDARRAATGPDGPRLTLPYLAQQFGLSEAEVDMLLVALAPELEPRYDVLYSYLQDDVTRRRPSVNLTLNLICRSEREKLFARRLLSPGAPLLHYQLLHLEEEPQDRQGSFARKFLKISPPVLRFLLEEPADSSESGWLVAPQPDTSAPEISAASHTAMRGAIESILRGGIRQTILRMRGHDTAALDSAAQTLAAAFNRKLLRLDLAQVEAEPARLVAAIRDSGMFDALLAISAPEPAPGESAARQARTAQQLWAELGRVQEPVALLGPAAAFGNPPVESAELHVWPIDIAGPEFPLRREAWAQCLTAAGVTADADTLADTFHFGGARVRQAVNLAYATAAIRDPSDPKPTQVDFTAAGRELSTPNLTRFAVPIQPRYTLADVILPAGKLAQIRAIGARMRFRRRVLDDWGFGEKLSRGKGNIALFTGQPGTGKTMAAEAIAHELGLNLFQIDLSAVVSKYIGETESNLSSIFREAENTSTLLFFDEADALFSKRTEVKDAHDRYANQEVNYLLQRVEQYEGLVILASNMQKNMDEAFLRRLQSVVDFPMPGELEREMIWRSQFPKGAPRDPDIDLPFLARQIKISGGSIRNIVLSAAFAAAEEGVPIAMRHITAALRLETLKQGKLVMKGELGPYFDLAAEVKA